ncbi:MAG: hypothetical protein L3J31_00425 [Bacteroidales bacterium]|nr:hypothetical protein [Bacteroidales bacterium]
MMWLKLLVLAMIVTAFLVVAMGLKLVFSKDGGVPGSSCHLDETNAADENQACSHCQVKEIVNCDEKPILNH